MTWRLIGAVGAATLVAIACGEVDRRPADAPPGDAPTLAPIVDATATGPASPPDASPGLTTFVPRCVDGDVNHQRHGATCVCCHDEFGVAGSVDPSGPPVARVIVTDALGDVATMAPNLFSNFFRHFKMTPPFRAVAYGPDGRAAPMQADSPSADCNACHYTGGAVGLIHGP